MNPALPSWSLIRELADWSALVYQPGVASVEDAGTHAGAIVNLSKDDDKIIVAFRGSCAPEDFIQDARFALKPLAWHTEEDHVQCHAGFLDDFAAIEEKIVSQVRAHLRIRPVPIYITGHSLGGALAGLAGLSLTLSELPPAAVITFGQPRIGNADFATDYNGTPVNQPGEDPCYLHDITWRVVNANDIVPRAPFHSLGYRHCGQEIFLKPGGAWELNPPLLDLLESDALGLLTAAARRKEVLVGDHLIAAYQERMKGL
jgi:hypothetical protein